jgi:hypothetical protein
MNIVPKKNTSQANMMPNNDERNSERHMQEESDRRFQERHDRRIQEDFVWTRKKK